MSQLYLLVSIVDRRQSKKFQAFYDKNGLSLSAVTTGRGTAASDILDFFGLEGSEKGVLFHVVSGEMWKKLKPGLQREMKIDVPGVGIAFTIPISSVGGKKALACLLGGQDFEKGEESVLKDTKYELLVVIADQGYTELIMDAARSVHAAGGTVLHAKGTGTEKAEKFLGVSLVAEKELVIIVVKREQKNEIMQAIMEKAGLGSPAHAIAFSLPVTSTAGMRLMEEEIEDM